MSLKILGPRPYFWQWDSGQKLVVGNCNCDEVHFCNGTKDNALVAKIETTDDGTRTVDVPNILLQVAEPIKAYLFHRNASGNMTRTRYIFQVIERPKPEDYIYTEEEILIWQQLSDRIDELEENPSGDYVKTVNNVSPDENGNVAIDLKEMLVVSVNYDLKRANARVRDIETAVNNNRHVILKINDNGKYIYNLDCLENNTAVFSNTYIYEGNIVISTVVVDDSGRCTFSYKTVGSSGGNAVLYTEQNLTEKQKAQARENIGIDGNGKSAYQYARDGGYTGTEEEFAEILANGIGSGESAFDPTAYGLPVLYLTGDTAGMTKDKSVTLDYVYGEHSGTASVKWQGSSSLYYPKKNYTIKFDNAFEAAEGWGEQKKYCLKANYIDHSHARNVVSAKLWGEIVKSRENTNAKLSALPNGGAIDGFPCIIMLNGDFHGMYTFNIPKDGWMFGMGNNDQTTVRETFGFGSWIVADSFNQSTGEYTPTASVTTYFVSQRSPAIGGRAYCTWDNQKIAEIAVKAHIFDAADTPVKAFGWSAAYDGKSGDFGEDALREPGNTDYFWARDSFSIPVPDGCYVIWEIWVLASTNNPDGTLTGVWSEEAEANGTWLFAWVKTGIEFSIVAETGAKEAVICAEGSSNETYFQELADFGGNDFKIEYISDGWDGEQAKTSINRLITACMNSNGTDLDTTVAQYLDLDSAIDYCIFACLIGGADIASKNYLLATFNGTKWYFSAYDMDSTYGLYWDGKQFLPKDHYPTVGWYAAVHNAMRLVVYYKKEAFKARYAELRNTVLSEDNVALAFENFVKDIPVPILNEDVKTWTTIPSSSVNNVSQIRDWYRRRTAFIDKEVENLT